MTKDLNKLLKQYTSEPINNKVMKWADISIMEWGGVCGDIIEVFLKINDGKLEEMSYMWNISKTTKWAASLYSDMLVGRDIDDIMELDKNTLQEKWLNIPTIKKSSMMLPLLAIINAIYKYKNQNVKVILDDLLM